MLSIFCIHFIYYALALPLRNGLANRLSPPAWRYLHSSFGLNRGIRERERQWRLPHDKLFVVLRRAGLLKLLLSAPASLSGEVQCLLPPQGLPPSSWPQSTSHPRQVSVEGLHTVVNKHHKMYPTIFPVIAGDFHKAILKKSLSSNHQQVSCSTRRSRTLDHCYSIIEDAFGSISHPHWETRPAGCAPSYKLPGTKECSPGSEDCTESVRRDWGTTPGLLRVGDWAIFNDSVTDLHEYAIVVF